MNVSTITLSLFILAVIKIVKQTFNSNTQHMPIIAAVISMLVSITFGLLFNDWVY